ncbi:hypothetical protein [Methylobacterium gnaphalii]|uniref:hypothetical protein n=1 Tax=Methylobacterium gnaphalii TaxID=1010610 RepID=UPI0011BF62E3|nr:hypothetical protein [Methylobacterium gnaphalii]
MSTRLLGGLAALVLTAGLQIGSVQAAPLTTGAGHSGPDDTTLVHSIRHRHHHHHHHHHHR